MSSRIPPLLEPYLTLPPEASLILLTSVLGASSNWLLLRFLHSALAGSNSPDSPTRVLLVSFMRDLTFWKENARRLGLDLDKFTAKKSFRFVDGLSGLFLSKLQHPLLGSVILSNSALASVRGEIQGAIRELQEAQGPCKILLVIDQLDLLLAAGGDQIRAAELSETLMDLREGVHATVMSLSADCPLVSSTQTPLETDHAAFLLSIAHQADFVMSLRLLDSGTARDVSGVVRVTMEDRGFKNDEAIHRQIEEKELLYFVGGDGGVKVFERGQ